MGMIDRFLGAGPAIGAIGRAASDVAGAFTPNATREIELLAEARANALAQMQAEFTLAPATWFDRFINGMNRLPRPALALGTMGLFVYAMADPAGFGLRMDGLAQVPEPLWWLLGAIVSFYFGAREAHYLRLRQIARRPAAPDAPADPAPDPAAFTGTPASDDFADNAALRDWAARRG
ncbi:holin family protein [Paracoccus jiaweipingae]|uniref:holin family protein n=1 Tax=unclassified Paracoccus (in: a-proteobacteria) TaxID=2688777 RepID=UPI003792984C